jgi:anti-sigma factor RsiW
MNVTRGIVTDLLPAYFSGEASEDTRRVVEDYFRENPDFERVARSAATPLETLRATGPIAGEAEKEKRELQCIGWELRSRRLWLVLALLYTVWSFAPIVSSELAEWLGVPHTQAGRIGAWSAAVVFWILYVIRPQRRQVPLAGALLFSLGEVLLVLVHLNILRDSSPADRSGWALIGFGALAAFLWILHFRWRRLDRQSRRRVRVRGAD